MLHEYTENLKKLFNLICQIPFNVSPQFLAAMGGLLYFIILIISACYLEGKIHGGLFILMIIVFTILYIPIIMTLIGTFK